MAEEKAERPKTPGYYLEEARKAKEAHAAKVAEREKRIQERISEVIAEEVRDGDEEDGGGGGAGAGSEPGESES